MAGVYTMDKTDQVKDHFEDEAPVYDRVIINLIPYYPQMIEALISALPFDPVAGINVLDLGCGTGKVSRAVLDAYPSARLSCLDMAQNMLDLARRKLADSPDARFICANFYHYSFDASYDAILSSLALHHMVTLQDKLDFYKKIYAALKPGGVFVNADLVLASTDALQALYMAQWKAFMKRNLPSDEVESFWIPKHYEEDRPVSLMDHLSMLDQAGFKKIDVIWKYYNFCVYSGVK